MTSTTIALGHVGAHVDNNEGQEQEAQLLPENTLTFKSTNAGAGDFALPPVDGGLYAWAFLCGCFLMEALVWDKRTKLARTRLCRLTRQANA